VLLAPVFDKTACSSKTDLPQVITTKTKKKTNEVPGTKRTKEPDGPKTKKPKNAPISTGPTSNVSAIQMQFCY